MRACQPASRFALSTSVVAISAAVWATPASAQTNAQQQQVQQHNVAVDCATVTDPAAHANCIRTQGQNAPAAAGAPAAGEIVVTGSRIPRPNFDTVQPSTVLNSQAIEQRGFVDAADALNELPQFGIPGSSPVGAAQGGAFGTGQSFINFLGLGSQRTLALINGRRFISSNTASLFGPTSPGEQVDLGQINTKIIDRIETEATGGAPIYGSDAIAGTINVILKHDYSGIDLDAQYGIADESGPGGVYGNGRAPTWRIRGLAGHNFADGRGNVTIAGEYNKGTGFTYLDRAVTAQSPFYGRCNRGSQFNQCLYPDGPRVIATTPTGIPLVGSAFGLDFAFSPQQGTQLIGAPFTTGVPGVGGGPDVMFDPAGNFTPFNYGYDPDNVFGLFFSGGNGFPYIYNTSQELSNTQKFDINLLSHDDFNDNVRLFTDTWYATSKITNLH